MVRVKQGALSGGILSEGMYSRSDTEKFGKAVKDAVNMFIRPQGGMANRAGLMAATSYDTSGSDAVQYLVPFSFNTEQNYHLEFSDGVFRVLQDGGYVLDTSFTNSLLRDVTTTTEAKVRLLNTADAVNYPLGSLVQIVDANGTHKLSGAVLKVVSEDAGAIGFTVFDGTLLDTTVGDWGELSATASLARVYQQEHPYDLADLPVVRFVQDADTMYLAHNDYPPHKIGRLNHDDWSVDQVIFTTLATPPSVTSETGTLLSVNHATRTNPVTVSLTTTDTIANGTSVRIEGVVGMIELNGRDFRVGDSAPGVISLFEHDGEIVRGAGYSAYVSGGDVASSEAIAEFGSDVDPADLTTYVYAVSTVLEDSGEESLPSVVVEVDNDLAYRGSINTIFWEHNGAARFNVYRKSAGAFGYVGTTSANSFVDENITPDVARGVQVNRNPFGAAGDYPAIVSYYEQRLAFGRTINDPQLVEMSRTENVENFNRAYPDLPDDAFRFRVRARQVNAIRGFVPHEAFAIMTSGGEWEIAPQGDGDYQRPDKRKLTPITYYGSYDIEPVMVGSVALFVEPSGNTIRDYRLADRSQPPGDLTILARDLFEDAYVTSWVYLRAPDGLLWVTLNTGVLLSMTYIPEHDIWGWTRHEVGGQGSFVHQVSGTTDGVGEQPYYVVSRTVGDRTVTMTEQLAKRNDRDIRKAYFLDGGYQMSTDEPVASVSGLFTLRGQTVTALIDGDVLDNLTVDNTGTVSFGDRVGSDISVGLPYEGLVQTLDAEFDTQQLGSSMGRYMSTSEVAVRLTRSRGVEVGQKLDKMTALKEWRADLVGKPITLKSGTELFGVDGDWQRDATTYVRQRHPLPLTVTGIAPSWEMGE